MMKEEKGEENEYLQRMSKKSEKEKKLMFIC